MVEETEPGEKSLNGWLVREVKRVTGCADRQRGERLIHPSLAARGDHDRCALHRCGLSRGETYP
jgi:hypothetical protein